MSQSRAAAKTWLFAQVSVSATGVVQAAVRSIAYSGPTRWLGAPNE